MADSSSLTPTPEAAASSLRALDSPPRVGSRMARIVPQASSMTRHSPCSGAQSLRNSVSKSSPSRTLITAMPWSPSVPDSTTASPGRADEIESLRPAGIRPIPVVVMNTWSPLPRSTTFVSPATRLTPASSHASRMDSTTRLRSSIARPSSRMNAAERKRGSAPPTARSLTVPQTARRPMSPPGKKMGRTTNESVVKASRSAPMSMAAWSSRARSVGLAKAGRKTCLRSDSESLPPLPWASRTWA